MIETVMLTKHFVQFFTPGIFFSETTEKEIETWDIPTAIEMSKTNRERYKARPYGFAFLTRGRTEGELDSRVLKRSGTYFLGGRIETLDEIDRRNDPEEKILRENMRGNGWDRVVVTSQGNTFPLKPDDVILPVD
jgi:hypothetical protein